MEFSRIPSNKELAVFHLLVSLSYTPYALSTNAIWLAQGWPSLSSSTLEDGSRKLSIGACRVSCSYSHVRCSVTE